MEVNRAASHGSGSRVTPRSTGSINARAAWENTPVIAGQGAVAALNHEFRGGSGSIAGRRSTVTPTGWGKHRAFSADFSEFPNFRLILRVLSYAYTA
jgi:hypothetical protein